MGFQTKMRNKSLGFSAQLNSHVVKEAATGRKTFFFLIYREKTSDTNCPQLSGLLSSFSKSILKTVENSEEKCVQGRNKYIGELNENDKNHSHFFIETIKVEWRVADEF